MATLFSLGCLVSELGVREGIFKKLCQRRPNKNVAGVNYVDETDLKVSCKRSANYWNERGYRDKPKTYPSVEPIIRFMNLILLIAK